MVGRVRGGGWERVGGALGVPMRGSESFSGGEKIVNGRCEMIEAKMLGVVLRFDC